YDFLDYPGFEAPFTTAIHNLLYSIPFATSFPTLAKWLQRFPEWALAMLDPKMKSVNIRSVNLLQEVRNQVQRIVAGDNDAHKSVEHRTVFHELLNSSIKKNELTEDMMQDEATSFTGAGIVTTKTALTVASFWILHKPEVKERLLLELERAISNPDNLLPLTELEKLPYLSAVVQESLSMSYGLFERLVRSNPTRVIQYGKYIIPPGTPFSISNHLQVGDPKIFLNPDDSLPGR
ncbi:cytochrome P450, partial [Periconia macrospinosa]